MIFTELMSACIPSIKFYVDDLLVHDREIIARYPGRPFLHWTRETGTHIAIMPHADDYPPVGKQVPHLFGTADREQLLDSVEIVAKCCNRDTRHVLIHYYDGQKLRTIEADQVQRIVSQYIVGVRRQWEPARASVAPATRWVPYEVVVSGAIK